MKLLIPLLLCALGGCTVRAGTTSSCACPGPLSDEQAFVKGDGCACHVPFPQAEQVIVEGDGRGATKAEAKLSAIDNAMEKTHKMGWTNVRLKPLMGTSSLSGNETTGYKVTSRFRVITQEEPPTETSQAP